MDNFNGIMATMDILTAKHDAAVMAGRAKLAAMIFTELCEYALLACDEIKPTEETK